MEKTPFIIYEYLTIPVKQWMEDLYINCYKSFGWQVEGMAATLKPNVSELKLKRNRRIKNREELKELQKQFEITLHKLEKLEGLKTSKGIIVALSTGLIGIALLTGAVFAYLHGIIMLSIVLAIPGSVGLVTPYFSYTGITAGQEIKMKGQIEELYDRIYSICERSKALISDGDGEL